MAAWACNEGEEPRSIRGVQIPRNSPLDWLWPWRQPTASFRSPTVHVPAAELLELPADQLNHACERLVLHRRWQAHFRLAIDENVGSLLHIADCQDRQRPKLQRATGWDVVVTCSRPFPNESSSGLPELLVESWRVYSDDAAHPSGQPSSLP